MRLTDFMSAAVLLAASAAHAGFVLGPVVVAAGGGSSSAAGYRASITIGQGLASAPAYSIGPGSKIATGFWATIRNCPADLNSDGFVDDSDFVLFANAYNLLLCSDPAMPAGCPADLTADAFVDDSDFVLFADAYNALLCP
jgi:hypothetical protein